MSSPVEEDEVENLEFKWGKKRGVGGKKKDIQFYDSFVYDGLEYILHDCVYLFEDGEPEPNIGKIIKIWQNPDMSKKVKILWFFRPEEILNWFADEETPENELFLACGEGEGLANVNRLEAIAGKCNVVCIAKDTRNPQPSEEELQMAEFVFYRTFDVGSHAISDKIKDKIAGIDVKFIFNRVDSQRLSGFQSPDSNGKENLHESPMTGVKLETELEDKIISKSNIDSGKEEGNSGKVISNQIEGGAKVKAIEFSGNVETRPFKKAKVGQNSIIEETSLKHESVIKENTTKKSKVDSNMNKVHASEVFVHQDEVREKPKAIKVSADSDTRSFKKASVDRSVKSSEDNDRNIIQNSNIDSNGVDVKDLPTTNSSEDKMKQKFSNDSRGADHNLAKNLKSDVKTPELSNGKSQNPSKIRLLEKNTKGDIQATKVIRRPVDRSRWFKGLPWEERMQNASKQETLVLLENLDPGYSSAEVEDIVWHGFKENCTAKMIQKIGVSSPHAGQALVIFKTREAAEKVVKRLVQGCLMLPNGRPLVGSYGIPCLPKKESTLVGHLAIDNPKIQMQREMKEAVSTSHCSQPNTIEYEMSMEWCLLQDRSENSWKTLYKRHGDEIKKVKAKLKSK